MTDSPTTLHPEGARRLRPLLAAVVGGLAVVALVASAEDNEATLVPSEGGNVEATGDGASDTEAPAAQRFAVGDTVALGDWEVTVNSVADPWMSPEEFDMAATGRYVEVDVTVVNNSTSAESVSSLVCFELRDADGRSLSQELLLGGGTSPDGEVDPGGRLSGSLYYDVPQGVDGLELRFSCDLFASGSAVIAL
jgi:hypothetical protein